MSWPQCIESFAQVINACKHIWSHCVLWETRGILPFVYVIGKSRTSLILIYKFVTVFYPWRDSLERDTLPHNMFHWKHSWRAMHCDVLKYLRFMTMLIWSTSHEIWTAAFMCLNKTGLGFKICFWFCLSLHCHCSPSIFWIHFKLFMDIWRHLIKGSFTQKLRLSTL